MKIIKDNDVSKYKANITTRTLLISFFFNDTDKKIVILVATNK